MSRVVSIVTDSDWIARYQDAGYDALIASVAGRCLADDAFIELMNLIGSQPAITWPMLLMYLADRQGAGALAGVQVWGESLPVAQSRPAAPSGLGSAEWGVWFSSPDTGTAVVRWYVNGALKIRREQDLSVNRSATLSELGASSGAVVQIAIEDGAGVVGWWARVALP